MVRESYFWSIEVYIILSVSFIQSVAIDRFHLTTCESCYLSILGSEGDMFIMTR